MGNCFVLLQNFLPIGTSVERLTDKTCIQSLTAQPRCGVHVESGLRVCCWVCFPRIDGESLNFWHTAVCGRVMCFYIFLFWRRMQYSSAVLLTHPTGSSSQCLCLFLFLSTHFIIIIIIIVIFLPLSWPGPCFFSLVFLFNGENQHPVLVRCRVCVSYLRWCMWYVLVVVLSQRAGGVVGWEGWVWCDWMNEFRLTDSFFSCYKSRAQNEHQPPAKKLVKICKWLVDFSPSSNNPKKLF